MKLKKLLSLGLAISIAMGSLAGCSSTKEQGKKGKDKVVSQENRVFDVLKQAGGTDWGMPNPYQHNSRGPGTERLNLVFDTLLEKDEKGIIPWSAEKWSVEGNTYKFTLRDGLKFHDGEDVTSEDIAFSLDYYKENPPVNDSLRLNGEFIVDNYKVVDSKNIEITVKENLATTIDKLGFFRILPKHIWEKVEDPATFIDKEAFIGSGPYKFSSYDAASGSYEFIAFDGYKNATPASKKIQYVPVSDEVLAFENKEIDMLSCPPDLAEKYSKDDNYKVVKSPAVWGYRLMLNMDKVEMFKKTENRQAMYHAMNREDYLQKIFRGEGVVANAAFLSPEGKYYNENVKKYKYDLKKSKSLIKDSVDVGLLCENKPEEIKLAELIKADLAKIGINITIKSVDMKVRDQYVREGNYEIALIGNGGWGGDPDLLRGIYQAKQNKDKGNKKQEQSKKGGKGNPLSMTVKGYTNDKINELCNKQLKELDKDKRKELTDELQFEISKEVPVLPLICNRSINVYRTDGYNKWMMTDSNPFLSQNKLSYINR